MSSVKCEQVNSLLIDFIELELPYDEDENVKQHLEQCNTCNTEYNRLRTMLNKIHKIPVHEPGEKFWNEFPEKVLSEVRHAKAKQTTADIIDFYRSKHVPETKAPSSLTLEPQPFSVSRLSNRARISASMAIAATLLLVINIVTFSPKSDGLWFDPLPFIAKLSYQTDVTVIANKLTSQSNSTVGYGFIDQQMSSINAFDIGALLAESMILVHVNKNSQARENVSRLFEYLQVQGVPLNVSTYLGQTIEALDQEKPAKSQLKLLSGFQSEFENYIIGKNYNHLMLFRTGLWSLNIGIAAAERNEQLLRAVYKSGEIQYLQKAYSRINVAPGVNKSLQDIAEKISNRPMSDRDFRSIEKSIENLQSLLS